MSYSYKVASAEFAALCQSQIKLLTKGLGAISSAIYLTEDVEGSQEKQLLLFALYPKIKNKLSSGKKEIKLLEKVQFPIEQVPNNSGNLFLEELAKNDFSNILLQQENLTTKKIVLPLIHEDVMMGLLITAREDRYWNKQELEQVKAIAKTLAIAIVLERQSQWYQEQLRLQQNLYHWQQEQLGDLLHQLRNPLTALRTFGKLLIKRLLPEDRNQSVAKSILQESDRLVELIDRFAEENNKKSQETPVTVSTTLQQLSFAESRQTQNFLLPSNTENLVVLDIKTILEPLLLSSKEIAENKNIKLIINLSSELPLVKGNAQALREVFNNILDNAVKYTPEKGTITVNAKYQNKLLGIAIEDTGYGIPKADHENIFQRHYRGIQATGNIPGTGLGLAIAKEVLEQMQGKIEIISPNPHCFSPDFPGTIFIIWLSIVEN